MLQEVKMPLAGKNALKFTYYSVQSENVYGQRTRDPNDHDQ